MRAPFRHPERVGPQKDREPERAWAPQTKVAFMQDIARERQMTTMEAVLEKCELERSFLTERCEQDWLTADQKATVRDRITLLNEESQILRWFVGSLQPELRTVTHL